MKRAAALDDTLATSNLGRLYWYGRGVRQSYAEARRCFIIAAANGDRTSVINLMNLDASIHRYAGPSMSWLPYLLSPAHAPSLARSSPRSATFAIATPSLAHSLAHSLARLYLRYSLNHALAHSHSQT